MKRKYDIPKELAPGPRRLYDALFNKVDWADVVNCTPHTINVYADVSGQGDFQEIVSIASSGIVPRVSVVETPHPDQDILPFLTVRNELGPVEGLPENDTRERLFIVSRMVLDASDRDDLIAPDTGRTAIRDEKGNIRGVTQFIKK